VDMSENQTFETTGALTYTGAVPLASDYAVEMCDLRRQRAYLIKVGLFNPDGQLHYNHGGKPWSYP